MCEDYQKLGIDAQIEGNIWEGGCYVYSKKTGEKVLAQVINPAEVIEIRRIETNE